MICQHLKDGRCLLAEILVRRELDISVECLTADFQCGRCLARGPATEEKPTIQVMGNALVALPRNKRPVWKAFWEFVTTGKPRGAGDRVEKALKLVGITKARAAKVAKAVGAKGCGCSGNQKKLNKLFPAK
jgi:hypothetical protein